MVILISVISFTVSSQNTTPEEILKDRQLLMQGQNAEASEILVEILAKLMETRPDNKQAVQFWLMANMKRSPTGEQDAIIQLDSLQSLYPKNTGICSLNIFFRPNTVK